MLVVAKSPDTKDGEESEGGSETAGRSVAVAARADFLIDEREERRNDEAEEECDEQSGLEDGDDVPGDPTLGKGPERANAVAVCVVEEDVAEAGETGIGVEQAPTRREIGIASFAAAHAPEQVHESDDRGGDDGDSEEGMREAAMVIEGEGGATEAAEDVEVGGFGGERERGRGESGFAIEAEASEVGAEEEVSDGFQGESKDKPESRREWL